MGTFVLKDDFKLGLKKVLMAHYFKITDKDDIGAYEGDLADHISGRYENFKDMILPWLACHCTLDSQFVVEIGSGTGSSSLALVQRVKHLHCFEIDKPSIEVAKWRLSSAGFTNADFYEQQFDMNALDKIGYVNGVFLGAVLEHTTFQECETILKSAWNILQPGGWLCVVDTPNRLAPMDHHTSLLPFFSMLPAEVRMSYAAFSSRADFAQVMHTAKEVDADGGIERLTRWGCGISYHEFELALGRDVHQNIIATGYEPEIDRVLSTLPDDTVVDLLLRMFAPHVNRAFSRRALHLIIGKPCISDHISKSRARLGEEKKP